MNECELVIFISSFACALSKCLSSDELSLLAAAFTQLGDTIATILTQREICDNSKDDSLTE